MSLQYQESLYQLRAIVGFLGEKGQLGWWDSQFYAPTSEMFLKPVFTRTTFLAKYMGANEAALRVHDERIGAGQHFHLYRLPDVIEKHITKKARDTGAQERLLPFLAGKDEALARLKELSGTEAGTGGQEGPVAIGNFQEMELDAVASACANHYFRTFSDGKQAYPYLRHAISA